MEAVDLCDTTIEVFVDGQLSQARKPLPDYDGLCISFIRRPLTQQEYNDKCDYGEFCAWLAHQGLTEDEDFELQTNAQAGSSLIED
eukprot:11517530-Karenia_brevis.AAC.1